MLLWQYDCRDAMPPRPAHARRRCGRSMHCHSAAAASSGADCRQSTLVHKQARCSMRLTHTSASNCQRQRGEKCPVQQPHAAGGGSALAIVLFASGLVFIRHGFPTGRQAPKRDWAGRRTRSTRAQARVCWQDAPTGSAQWAATLPAGPHESALTKAVSPLDPQQAVPAAAVHTGGGPLELPLKACRPARPDNQ